MSAQAKMNCRWATWSKVIDKEKYYWLVMNGSLTFYVTDQPYSTAEARRFI